MLPEIDGGLEIKETLKKYDKGIQAGIEFDRLYNIQKMTIGSKRSMNS